LVGEVAGLEEVEVELFVVLGWSVVVYLGVWDILAYGVELYEGDM
jgi:hypothetical protein